MASLQHDLSCPVCLEIFTDPVVLSCGHSFCRTCLQQSWTVSSERVCPVCRRRSSRDHPPPDLALRNACESYMQKRGRDSGSQDLLCSLHFEKLSLFCVDDQMLVCGQCVSQDHQSHSFSSVSKAAGPHKEKIQTHLTELEKKLQILQKVKDISDQAAAHIKSQAQNTERQIKEGFEKLHQFLREEEGTRIVALRKEAKEKSQRMKKKIEELDSQIKDISARIAESEKKLKDDALVLQDVQRMQERAQYTEPDPKLDSGALIDVAKHLGNLRYRVWGRMKDLCPYFPVILDPNTANSSLSLSADLSSISHSAENPQLPDIPERMSAYNGVLGSEGFTSGTHSWEVEVGDGEEWVVGVAEESVSRKETCVAVPENGFCCIWRVDNAIYSRTGINSVIVAKKETLKTIRVTVNWEAGHVIFFSKDENKVLNTLKHRFTQKMYPYFYYNSTNSVNSMKIHSFPSYVTIKQ